MSEKWKFRVQMFMSLSALAAIALAILVPATVYLCSAWVLVALFSIIIWGRD